LTIPPDDLKKSVSFNDVLQKIRQSSNVTTTADPKTIAEAAQLEHDRKRTEISGVQQDIAERKKYAARCFWLVTIWLALIGLIVFLQGFRICGFSLPNSVLITLIGSTTGSVVGIFLIVTRYLFPRR